MGKIPVQAANPLAPPGVPLYHIHGKVGLYNDIFFMLWDCIIGESLAIIAPWFTIDCKKVLEMLSAFKLHIER